MKTNGLQTPHQPLLNPEKTKATPPPVNPTQTAPGQTAETAGQKQTSAIKLTISPARKIEQPEIIKELSNLLEVPPGKILDVVSGLDPKEQEKFLSFAATLSKENLEHVFTVAENSPQAMKALMDTASELSGDDLDNYLSAAAMAGKDVMEFTQNVEQQFKASGNDHGKQVSDYLSAAAKSGENVMAFIEGMEKFSSPDNKTIKGKILDFINSQEPGTNLDNFSGLVNGINGTNGTDEKTIESIVDTASSLSGKDQENFLATAAQAGEKLQQFAGDVKKLLDENSGASSEVSNYIATAANAEDKLDVLSRVAHKIDLSFTSGLSKVDTVNFLAAAEKNESDIAQLTDMAEKLSSNDKSNLLYAAAHTDVNVSDFLNETDSISNQQERSQFLLLAANKGNETIDSVIFMKGLLSADEFENLHQTGAFLDENQQNQLIASVNDMDAATRKDFLEMAAGAKEAAGELAEIASNNAISSEEQKAFIKAGSDLSGDSLQHYIHGASAAAKTSGKGTFASFVDLAANLKGSAKGDLLKAAANAGAKEMASLMEFVNTLDSSEQASFLKTSADSGSYLSGLIDMGAKVKERVSAQEFIQIFDSAANAGTNHIGKFIETFA